MTHHAEDGSGVGSAIIAGKSRNDIHGIFDLITPYCSDDENQERCWLVYACLKVGWYDIIHQITQMKGNGFITLDKEKERMK